MSRIITVDPTGTISRIVRSAMDLLDRPMRQIDVPSGTDALEELGGGCDLLVAAYDLQADLKGFIFAIEVKKASPKTSVIILGEEGDPEDFDEETAKDSPYVYMTRPVDVQKFLRVLVAGLESHEAMIAALNPPALQSVASTAMDMGPVPKFDISAAQNIVDPLLRELSAMAIIIASRDGQVLLERGAVGYINRERLVTALLPILSTNIGVKDLVGGNISSIQFYDGDDYDVFVLSIGFHHFMCVMYNGQTGSKNFGGITRWGRRAVEDLIALLGANAFFFQPAVKKEEPVLSRTKPIKLNPKETEEAEQIVLARAVIDVTPAPALEMPEAAPKLEPIVNLNLDDIFGAAIDDLGLANDIFDFDNMEEAAKTASSSRGKELDWDQAEQLGLLK